MIVGKKRINSNNVFEKIGAILYNIVWLSYLPLVVGWYFFCPERSLMHSSFIYLMPIFLLINYSTVRDFVKGETHRHSFDELVAEANPSRGNFLSSLFTCIGEDDEISAFFIIGLICSGVAVAVSASIMESFSPVILTALLGAIILLSYIGYSQDIINKEKVKPETLNKIHDVENLTNSEKTAFRAAIRDVINKSGFVTKNDLLEVYKKIEKMKESRLNKEAFECSKKTYESFR